MVPDCAVKCQHPPRRLCIGFGEANCARCPTASASAAVSKRAAPPREQTAARTSKWVFSALAGAIVGATLVFAGTRRSASEGELPAADPARPALDSDLTATQRSQIEAFVQEYFGTWSRKDIVAYGRCFHPNARIWFGTDPSLGLAEFLESQRQAHANSPVPLTEDPLAWDARINNGLAHVRVHWELHRGTEDIRGYDFFTLALVEGRWQIVALVFNQE